MIAEKVEALFIFGSTYLSEKEGGGSQSLIKEKRNNLQCVSEIIH